MLIRLPREGYEQKGNRGSASMECFQQTTPGLSRLHVVNDPRIYQFTTHESLENVDVKSAIIRI